MSDRGPVFLAMTVSAIALLATGIGTFLALSQAAQPVAIGLGGIGLIAAFLGLFAILQWVRQAEDVYPDYRYRRQLERGPVLPANEPAPVAPPRIVAAAAARRPLYETVHLRSLGDNIVIFDPLKRRRARRAAALVGPA